MATTKQQHHLSRRPRQHDEDDDWGIQVPPLPGSQEECDTESTNLADPASNDNASGNNMGGIAGVLLSSLVEEEKNQHLQEPEDLRDSTITQSSCGEDANVRDSTITQSSCGGDVENNNSKDVSVKTKKRRSLTTKKVVQRSKTKDSKDKRAARRIHGRLRNGDASTETQDVRTVSNTSAITGETSLTNTETDDGNTTSVPGAVAVPGMSSSAASNRPGLEDSTTVVSSATAGECTPPVDEPSVAGLSSPVEAHLVEEETAHVHAQVATEDPANAIRDLNHAIREMIHEERGRKDRTFLYAALILICLAIAVVAVVLGTIFGLRDTGGGGAASTTTASDGAAGPDLGAIPPSTLPPVATAFPPTLPPTVSLAPTTTPPSLAPSETPTPDPRPRARCQDKLVKLSSGTSCEVQAIDPLLLDNGSSADGGSMEVVLSISPPGPYSVGEQTLTLVVTEPTRDAEDICQVRVLIVDDGNKWLPFRNHAYRIRSCKQNWQTAKIFAERTTQCGLSGHLATITSAAERDFIVSQREEDLWLGASQPDSLPASAQEPEGGWTWVNNEGLVFDGFTDWDNGEPNSSNEDCMLLLTARRGFQWDDRPCSGQMRYLEEIETNFNVIINGCDSNVAERFVDVDACTYLITPQIENCGSPQTNANFDACVDAVLTAFVSNGDITNRERQNILFCGVPNEPPLALCQDIQLFAGSGCNGEVSVDASMVNAGSSDPDGDPLSFELSPSGPFGIGLHTLILTVDDGREPSTCRATLTVSDDGSLSAPWVQSPETGNVYRLRLCSADWDSANTFAASTEVCGVKAHLVTIKSQAENDLVYSNFGTEHWLGGFQPDGSEEPNGGWMWVNNEGLIFDADSFLYWYPDRPNDRSGRENCLKFKNMDRWDDSGCNGRRNYIEEVDLGETVVINGCDSGVVDLIDINSCTYPIREVINNCAGGVAASMAQPNNETRAFDDCLEEMLADLVASGQLTSRQKHDIQFCGSGNQAPVAQCQARIERFVSTDSSNCTEAQVQLSVSDVNDGSFDTDDDLLEFALTPPGPYTLGVQTVTLTVTDGSGVSDTCQTTVVIREQDVLSSSTWVQFNNHAYRVRFCGADWTSASTFSAATSLCGVQGHLATITSQAEQDFIDNLFSATGVVDPFVGAFQPAGSSVEPEEGWMWVNEGLVFRDGSFRNWGVGEPNNSGNGAALDEPADCMILAQSNDLNNSMVDAASIWRDVSCQDRRPYIEEVDFDSTVVIAGCVSPVPDILDIETCTYLITEGLAACNSNNDVAQVDFDACADSFLGGLVGNGTLSQDDRDLLLSCRSANQPPNAICQERVEISVPNCAGSAFVDAMDVDNGSSDPDPSDILLYSISPQGPLSVGLHTVTLTVEDGRGGTDACQSIVLVTDDGSQATQWLTFNNHGYRIRFCAMDWGSAALSAESTIQCGIRGHLVTVTSQEESDFIESIGVGDLWLGGFQPPDSQEPVGDWTWVNGEGQVFDGFRNWDGGEPNDGGNSAEDCLFLHGAGRGFNWDDRTCSKTEQFWEEVDLETPVMVNGCEFVDTLLDANTCKYMIADAISSCAVGADSGQPEFVADPDCVGTMLSGYVDDGLLSETQKDSITNCVRFGSSGRMLRGEVRA